LRRILKWGAMVKGAVRNPIRCIDVSVDVHEPDRPRGTERLQDRVGNGMVSAGRNRYHSCFVQLVIELVYLGDDTGEVECAGERHITDVGNARQFKWDDLRQGVVVRDVAGGSLGRTWRCPRKS
jgi:hypothetical protein